MAKHVLIMGFEPFGGSKLNPSDLVARGLEGRLIAGRLVVTRTLPVETRSLGTRIADALNEEQPDLVICMGQAGGRTAIALERVAVNVLDFEMPDNVGVMRRNDAILRGGPEARVSTLPMDRIIEAWHTNGIPSYISNSAGTYICNQALYEMLNIVEPLVPPVLAGFVHLPYLPAQAIEIGAEKTPSMSFELMKKAMEILLETVVPWIENRTVERVRQPAGARMWIPRGVKEVER